MFLPLWVKKWKQTTISPYLKGLHQYFYFPWKTSQLLSQVKWGKKKLDLRKCLIIFWCPLFPLASFLMLTRSLIYPTGSAIWEVGRCASTAGRMISPGRLVIWASSRDRDDIYFSNPRPWGWKMHVSSLAKVVWVIIYACVSSSVSWPYWLGVWYVMHDASLSL